MTTFRIQNSSFTTIRKQIYYVIQLELILTIKCIKYEGISRAVLSADNLTVQ